MKPTPEVLLKAAKKNKEFLDDIYKADKDKPPNIFSTETYKMLFMSLYYGWLIGKYGPDKWQDNV